MTSSPFLLKTSFMLLDQQKKPALLPVHRRIRLCLIVGRSPRGWPTFWGYENKQQLLCQKWILFFLKSCFVLLDQLKKPALLPVHRRIRLYLIVGHSSQWAGLPFGVMKIKSNCCARNGKTFKVSKE